MLCTVCVCCPVFCSRLCFVTLIVIDPQGYLTEWFTGSVLKHIQEISSQSPNKTIQPNKTRKERFQISSFCVISGFLWLEKLTLIVWIVFTPFSHRYFVCHSGWQQEHLGWLTCYLTKYTIGMSRSNLKDKNQGQPRHFLKLIWYWLY